MVNQSAGVLIVIAGPSGVGKGTIIYELLKSMPELLFSVSATTREPRETEKNGVDYFFVSQAEFEKQIQNNEFIEWAQVHGNFYGTPRRFIETALAAGKEVVLDIDVQGSLQVHKAFPDGVFVFLVPPTFEELRKRLMGRHTEKEAQIERRLSDAQEELRHLKEYNYLVINDILKEAVEDVRSIIRAERCRTSRRINKIQHALSPD